MSIEWTIFAIVVAVIGCLVYLYPQFRVMLINSVIKILIDKEHILVQATYNALPKPIRSNVDSKIFAEIVANTIRFGIKSVERDLTKK